MEHKKGRADEAGEGNGDSDESSSGSSERADEDEGDDKSEEDDSSSSSSQAPVPAALAKRIPKKKQGSGNFKVVAVQDTAPVLTKLEGLAVQDWAQRM